MNRPITYGRGSVCHSNHEHYRDPTAAAAFMHIQQEERRQREKKEAAERLAQEKERQRRLERPHEQPQLPSKHATERSEAISVSEAPWKGVPGGLASRRAERSEALGESQAAKQRAKAAAGANKKIPAAEAAETAHKNEKAPTVANNATVETREATI